EPPGPGGWDLDRSHYPGGTTLISQALMRGCAVGMRKAFAELGMPADTLDIRFVEGFMYSRLRPLIAPTAPLSGFYPCRCSSSWCGCIPRCGDGPGSRLAPSKS